VTLLQIPLESGRPIGTIRDLRGRKDLKLIEGTDEVKDLKGILGERARPYTGFYLRRNEYGSIIELYGFHEHRSTAPIFAVEPERRRKQ